MYALIYLSSANQIPSATQVHLIALAIKLSGFIYSLSTLSNAILHAEILNLFSLLSVHIV